MSAFDRLSSALAYQIANTLGWRELRLVQEQSIDAILDGKNAVVLAPTAGGKTEAAFFPILSQMDTEDWRPVSVIYLSPIRALLNNQEDRVARLAGLIGRRSFKWHGDVGPGERRRFLRDPTDILLITPESLEAMLMSSSVPTRELFAKLRAVIIDEIHAFADDDRGAHLSAVIERILRFTSHDVQRIGLSATVGNPEEILGWIRGSSERQGAVVDPKGSRREPKLDIDYVGSMETAAVAIERLHPSKKRLVFVDSRGKAEKLGNLLNDRGVISYVTHGSLSAAARRDAERAFEQSRDCVIVATSALELGIDVGDLDHVLQINAPATVASFLQRMGRTGRRPDMTPNCTFLALDEMAVLGAAALVQLFRDGFVESVEPSSRASHIFAHQLMTLGIQLDGVLPQDVDYWLRGSAAFSRLGSAERKAIVDHMLSQEILADHSGKLWLGPVGERRFGRAHFKELYAVFDAPRDITVRAGPDEVGTVEARFLAAIDNGPNPGSFMLAGKSWEIITVEWDRGVCVVRPSPRGRTPRWQGEARHLSHDLCQAMRKLLVSDERDDSWSERATRVMTTLRSEFEHLRGSESSLIEAPDRITWWNFAGGGANALLRGMLEQELGEKVVATNAAIKLEGDAAKSGAAVREVLARWKADERPTAEDALRAAPDPSRTRVSKFQVCLPEALLAELVVEKVLDVEGARRALSAPPTATSGGQTGAR
ncbi:MAG: DEAD/DEAH box helicase [Myxococcales bacterium]|nr:DEAD/DEAH box helicase [Myxococcales bacterium]